MMHVPQPCEEQSLSRVHGVFRHHCCTGRRSSDGTDGFSWLDVGEGPLVVSPWVVGEVPDELSDELCGGLSAELFPAVLAAVLSSTLDSATDPDPLGDGLWPLHSNGTLGHGVSPCSLFSLLAWWIRSLASSVRLRPQSSSRCPVRLNASQSPRPSK